MVKNPPAMQETQVPFLGQEKPLEKGKATHFSIFAWRIPWTGETGRLQSLGSQRVEHDGATNTFTFYSSQRCVQKCTVLHPGLPQGGLSGHTWGQTRESRQAGQSSYSTLTPANACTRPSMQQPLETIQ